VSAIKEKVQKVTNHPRPLRFLASRLLWHSGLCPILTISRDNYSLRFYPSACSASMWLDSDTGKHDEAVFRKLLRPGDIVIDVGANIGSLTLAASSLVGPTGKVFSVEAHPIIYKYLIGNLKLNNATNVTAFNVACGRESGVAHFSDNKSDDQNSISDDGLQVPIRRLDELIEIPAQACIALLKIDVEGYEKPVLEGCTSLLARTNAVYFESWEQHVRKYGYRLAETFSLLRDFGFQIQRPGGEPVDPDYRSVDCENLLATKLELVA